MVCFSRRAACQFERAEQRTCRRDATRLPDVPFVSYIACRPMSKRHYAQKPAL